MQTQVTKNQMIIDVTKKSGVRLHYEAGEKAPALMQIAQHCIRLGFSHQ